MVTTAVHPKLDPKLVRERLARFLAESRRKGQPITQSDVVRSLGRGASPSMLSAFMGDDYRGNVERLCQRLTVYIDEQELKAQLGKVVLPYVDTRQAQVAIQCMDLSLAHHWMVAIFSESGHGKSKAVEEYCRQHPGAIRLEPWITTCPSGLMQDICLAVGKSDKGTTRGLQRRLVDCLKGADRLLIVDDAHDLGVKSLQVLRNVYDQTGIGIALLGNHELEVKLAGTTPELEQIARRVIYKRRLPSWVDADAKQQLAGTLKHLDADKVLSLFHHKAKSSAAWVGKTITLAVELSEQQALGRVTYENLREALELVA